MKSKEEIKEFTFFIAEYASCLLGSGVHTSRVIRNSSRIAEALGLKIQMTTFPNSLILTVSDPDGEYMYTEVVQATHLPISFTFNSELSSLSWLAIDKKLTLNELREQYQAIIAKPRLNSAVLIVLVGMANASFCALFGGDYIAMIMVLFATMIGFSLRLFLQKKGVNHFVVFTLAAFVTSFLASFTAYIGNSVEVAVATSVLFLIPGVPLINGVIDILEGHILSGGAKLVQAILFIICIAIGLSASLFISQNSLI